MYVFCMLTLDEWDCKCVQFVYRRWVKEMSAICLPALTESKHQCVCDMCTDIIWKHSWGGRGGAKSRWCCYFHEIPQKPDEGAVRRVRGAFITSTPTVFVGKTSKSKDYRKDTSNEKPVNNTPGQRVDGRPKPHQWWKKNKEVVQPKTEKVK